MTTFDDTGIFDTVDEDTDEQAPPRRGWRAAAPFVVAGALLVAGVAWLLGVRAADSPAADAMSVALLAREVQPTDALAPEVAEETGIDPSSSRFAVRTSEGQHYAALRWAGDLCLVVVPEGDAARAICAPATRGAVVTASGADGSQVRLGTDDAPAPDADEGWRPAGTNVWVLDAPAAG